MAIDFHSHWVPPELAEELRRRRIAPWIERRGDGSEALHMPVGTLPYDKSFSDIKGRLAFMDEHGIDLQLLSFPGLFGLDSRPVEEAAPLLALFNQATSEVVRADPKRFAGLAALPFAEIKQAAADYRAARTEWGLAGAILPNNFFLSIAQAQALAPVFRAAAETGGHLFIHPGRRPDEAEAMDAAGLGRYADSVMARRQLEIQHEVAQAMVTLLWGDLLDKFEGFSLHLANIGGTLPLVIERMDQTAKLRAPEPVLPSERLARATLYVDCSSMGARAIEAAVACYGADRMLFGSDCPIYRSDWTLAAVRAADLDDRDREKLLRGNGRALLERCA